MSWLLIDNSNTRTKITLGDADGLKDWRAIIVTPELSEESLAKALSDLKYEAAVVCSVVPEKRELMRRFFEGKVPVHFMDHESPIGMSIDYPEPSAIGADRLANAAGVLKRHGAPVIVVDFGTAVTFDVISGQPAYCGGAIAPGLGAMSDYLARKTALLEAVELEEPEAAIGKSTRQAMLSGAVHGYRGLVREILARITRELEGEPKVVATGGDADLIAKGVAEIEMVDRDLTLEGLRVIATRVFGDSNSNSNVR